MNAWQRADTPSLLVLTLVVTASCSSGSTGADETADGGHGGALSGGRGGSGGEPSAGHAQAGSGGLAGASSGGQAGGRGGAAAAGGSTGSAGHAGALLAGAGGHSNAAGQAGTGGAAEHGGQAGGGSSGRGGRDGSGGAAGSAAGSSAAGASGGGGQGGGGGQAGGGAVASKGCGQTPTLKDGTQSIQSSGQMRSYMIKLPANYDNNHPYWLIFGYHWVGGTANDVDSGGTSGYTWSYYGLREQADKSTEFRAIFVAPQGISNGWANSNNQDVVFTDDMLTKLEGDLCIDTKHVFSTGFSYGGGMTKALGCQRPTVFRAIAVYSGADFLSGGCDDSTTSPVAFFGSHSISDGTNSYSSGLAILNRFAKNDGCTAQTPPEPAQGSNTHVCTNFQGCKAGYPVEWCAFNGGGHTPAPVDGSSNGSGGGDVTWTKTEVWKFFTQF